MRIRNIILLLMMGFLILVTAGFITLNAHLQRHAFESGVDNELKTAAIMARDLLPPNYHDKIKDKNSLSSAEYLKIVDHFNQLCVAANLEYLWSLMVLDGKTVFTSATSPSKDYRKMDHALFLEVHSNPELYTKALETMQPQFQVNSDKWGKIRAVLVPFRDSLGRPYLIGASRSMRQIDDHIHVTLISSIVAGSILMAMALLLCLYLANYLSRPIEKLTKLASSIAGGNLTQKVEIHGAQEVEILGTSINTMANAIDERIRALAESEQRFSIFMDHLPLVAFIKDKDGKFLMINKYLSEFIGNNNWFGKTSNQLLPPETAKKMMNDDRRAMAQGLLVSEEVVKERLFETYKFPIPIPGGAALLGGIALDITDRKKAQNAIAGEKERLLVTLRSIGDGVITTDKNGNVTLMNKVAEELTGFSMAEALNRPLFEIFNIVNETTKKKCESPVDKVLQSGEIYELANHTALIAKDGTERIIADSGAPIRDADNAIVGVVLVFRDITEKKKIEENLRNSQKLESLGILAGGIAHDFNNLLGGIFGHIELARDRCAKKEFPKIENYLNDALSVFERAKDLTQQLLTFSKGGRPIKKSQDLVALIRNSTQFVLSGSSINFHFDIVSGLWGSDIDENQIGQVIDNVVINAQQAMPNGGTITVQAQNLPADGVIPKNLKPQNYVVISVQDTGPGIPKDILPKIFDPFFTTKAHGSGLGLATAFSIMKNHEGLVEVESEVGKGTRINLYLPAITSAIVGEGIKEVMGKKITGHILVMDDDADIRNISLQLLKNIGHTVETAANGEEAIKLFRNAYASAFPFDVVILDLTVRGGMGGEETVQELQRIDANLLAVAASGYVEDSIMASPMAYGFIETITKPFRPKNLENVLQ
ncbi:MAG: PAS domain S-box protein, partial [Pseudomonadota bacterium]